MNAHLCITFPEHVQNRFLHVQVFCYFIYSFYGKNSTCTFLFKMINDWPTKDVLFCNWLTKGYDVTMSFRQICSLNTALLQCKLSGEMGYRFLWNSFGCMARLLDSVGFDIKQRRGGLLSQNSGNETLFCPKWLSHLSIDTAFSKASQDPYRACIQSYT
jgi:hypothetical protein